MLWFVFIISLSEENNLRRKVSAINLVYFFMTGSYDSGQRKLAIPLCLPNNWEWDPRTGKCYKKGDRRSSLYVIHEALVQLRQIKGNRYRGDGHVPVYECMGHKNNNRID